jgi:murein DD-endopeptidase MepM/ murein hydrolase activator NlpD
LPDRLRSRPSRPDRRMARRQGTAPEDRLRRRLLRLVDAARRVAADRAVPVSVALIVLVASAASVPAAAGTSSLAVTAPRVTIDDPVLGPAAAEVAPSAALPAANDPVPAIGSVLTGGTPSDPWVFTPLTVIPTAADLAVASLHRVVRVARIAPRVPSKPAATRVAAVPGFAPLLWPVPGGYISQVFGCTGVPQEPAFGSCPHYHNGIDIAAQEGTPILAAAAGTVVFAGWRSNGGGYQVWVSDGHDMYTGYHHMSSIAVYTGERIRRGQRIGAVGMTGNATGPHCHFMVSIGPFWSGGRAVDPRHYL